MRKLIYRNEKGQEITLSNSGSFYLENIENTSSNSANIISSSINHGIQIDNISIRDRSLPVTGGIVGDDREDLNRKRNLLTQIFNPLLSGELTYSNENFTRKINVSIDSVTFKEPISNLQHFLIQFIAPTPFWRETSTKKTDIALWEGNFEFEFETGEEGVDLGYRVSNLICNVFNSGDVKCGMKIQFRALATVENPSLININTREFIKINKVLEAGDIIEVTSHYDNKKITLINNNSVVEDIYGYLDIDSEFLQLDLGDNLFRYDADSGIDNLEVSIYHSNLYLGI